MPEPADECTSDPMVAQNAPEAIDPGASALPVVEETAPEPDLAVSRGQVGLVSFLDALASVQAQMAASREAAALMVDAILRGLEAASPTDPELAARAAMIGAYRAAEDALTKLDAQLSAIVDAGRQSLLASVGDPEGPNGESRARSPSGNEAVESTDEDATEVRGTDAPFGPVFAEDWPADGVGPSNANGHANDGEATEQSPGWSRLDMQVSKFANFGDLNEYRDALAIIPGVKDVKIRRVHKGVLFLSVDYDGIIPLPDRLPEIKEHPPQRVSVAGNLIQVALASSVAAEGGED